MNENEMIDDEISLFDLLEKLGQGWRYWLGGSLLGGLAAGTAIFLLPPKFEAVAIVQVGQVGQVGQAAPMRVEPPSQAAERIKSPSFRLAVAQQVEDSAWIQALTDSAGTSGDPLAVRVLKTAPLIELKASAKSPDHARAITNAAIQELARKHDELANATVEKLRSDLSTNKERLSKVELELKGLQKLAAGSSIRDDRFTQLSLIAALRVQKENEVFGLRQSIAAYEAALLPPATQPARALEKIYAGNRPVSPRKTLLLALGLLGGLSAGLLALFVADARKRWKQQ